MDDFKFFLGIFGVYTLVVFIILFTVIFSTLWVLDCAGLLNE